MATIYYWQWISNQRNGQRAPTGIYTHTDLESYSIQQWQTSKKQACSGLGRVPPKWPLRQARQDARWTRKHETIHQWEYKEARRIIGTLTKRAKKARRCARYQAAMCGSATGPSSTAKHQLSINKQTAGKCEQIDWQINTLQLKQLLTITL